MAGRGGGGAWVALIIGALIVIVAGIGYMVWSGRLAAPSVKLGRPVAPAMPDPAPPPGLLPTPGPNPIPSPVPKPKQQTAATPG